eukprot:2397772-Amphidinium_carterae.1
MHVWLAGHGEKTHLLPSGRTCWPSPKDVAAFDLVLALFRSIYRRCCELNPPYTPQWAMLA